MKISRERWLQERQRSIGASEIAAVLGLSKFQTALEVYKKKVGELPLDDGEDEPYRRRGTIMEPIIIDEYCRQTGAELVEYAPEILRHPEHKFLSCSLDSIVKNPAGDEWNVDAKALDASTARELGDEDSDRLPDDYFYQGHFQNFITRRFKTDFAVEVGGRWPLKIFSIVADDEFCQLLVEHLAKFWWHVENRHPIEPDFTHQTTLALMKKLHPRVDPDMRIKLEAKWGPMLERYWALGRIAKKAEEVRSQINAELRFEMGDAAAANVDDAPIIVERQAINGGAVVNYVTSSYVKLNLKFPKKHEHPLAPKADESIMRLVER